MMKMANVINAKDIKKDRLMTEFKWPTDNNIYSMSPELKKGTAIYRLKLEKIDGNYALAKGAAPACHYTDSVSGICRFVEFEQEKQENEEKQEKQLKRFIILNFHGIYNFKFN